MADSLAPALVSLSPAHQANGVAVEANIVLSFDEPVVLGTGFLWLFDVFGNLMFEIGPAGGTQAIATAIGSRIEIDPARNLPGNVMFQVASTAGVAQDLAGNASLPLPVYRFTTAAVANDPYRYGTLGNDSFTPDAAQQTFVGGPGVDVVHLAGARGAQQLLQAGGRYIIADAPAGTRYELLNIERLHFADSKLALDLDGNAGWVAQIIGAVFGREAVANAKYVGIGLQLADGGVGFNELVAFALQARFGPAPDAATLVQTLYTNVVGTPPAAADVAFLVERLERHEMTSVDMGAFAAQHPLNLLSIDLVGLTQTGLLYES